MTGRIPALLIALLLVFGSLLFVERALVNGRLVNTDITDTDQGAYIKQAIQMRQSDFAYVTGRNRMPMYPGLLALFMDKEALENFRREAESRQERDASVNADKLYFKTAGLAFFDTGKKINVALGLLTAIFAGVVFFWRFPWHQAVNLTVMAAFTVLVFKAAHVQAEILYYLLTFAVFLLCWRLFQRPSWWVAVMAGGILGVAHLTKASVLPGLLVVAVFLPLDALWRRGKEGAAPVRALVAAAIVVVAFLAAVYPYIATSKAMFGRYFYNVNSTFYMWCDSWPEAKSRTGDAGDRKGWPDLPADQLPSFSNYLKTHSAGQIAWRIVKGISVVFNSMMSSYGYLWICLGYLAFAAGLIAWKWRLALRFLRRRPFPILALLAYFCGYYLLVAWYSPIINGNRFILGLFLPFLFTVSTIIVALAPRWQLHWAGRKLNGLSVFNTVMSAWIVVQVAVICLLRIPTMYGGR